MTTFKKIDTEKIASDILKDISLFDFIFYKDLLKLKIEQALIKVSLQRLKEVQQAIDLTDAENCQGD